MKRQTKLQKTAPRARTQQLTDSDLSRITGGGYSKNHQNMILDAAENGYFDSPE